MEEKEIKINVPAGYVFDKENSTFECIKFKKKESRFADYDGSYCISGFYLGEGSVIQYNDDCNDEFNKNVFVSKCAAKSALAFAQITQIRRHEIDRYGCLPSNDDTPFMPFYIWASRNTFNIDELKVNFTSLFSYLAFNTKKQAELFLKENTQLVKDYYMMD